MRNIHHFLAISKIIESLIKLIRKTYWHLLSTVSFQFRLCYFICNKLRKQSNKLLTARCLKTRVKNVYKRREFYPQSSVEVYIFCPWVWINQTNNIWFLLNFVISRLKNEVFCCNSVFRERVVDIWSVDNAKIRFFEIFLANLKWILEMN